MVKQVLENNQIPALLKDREDSGSGTAGVGQFDPGVICDAIINGFIIRICSPTMCKVHLVIRIRLLYALSVQYQ